MNNFIKIDKKKWIRKYMWVLFEWTR